MSGFALWAAGKPTAFFIELLSKIVYTFHTARIATESAITSERFAVFFYLSEAETIEEVLLWSFQLLIRS